MKPDAESPVVKNRGASRLPHRGGLGGVQRVERRVASALEEGLSLIGVVEHKDVNRFRVPNRAFPAEERS